jgi:hypothetical protein
MRSAGRPYAHWAGRAVSSWASTRVATAGSSRCSVTWRADRDRRARARVANRADNFNTGSVTFATGPGSAGAGLYDATRAAAPDQHVA